MFYYKQFTKQPHSITPAKMRGVAGIMLFLWIVLATEARKDAGLMAR